MTSLASMAQGPPPGGFLPGQMVLVPDPACSGGWTLSVVLALQADDMVVVQHTSGGVATAVPAAGLRLIEVPSSNLQQDTQQQPAQQQRQGQQSEQEQQQQQPTHPSQQPGEAAPPQSQRPLPPSKPHGGGKGASRKRSAAAMDVPAPDATPAPQGQGETVSGIYTYTQAQADAIRAWEQQWQQASQPGQRCLPSSKEPDPRLPPHCIQFHVRRIPGPNGVNKPVDTYYMAPDATQRNTVGKLLIQMGLAEKEPAKRPARKTAGGLAWTSSTGGLDTGAQSQQHGQGSSRDASTDQQQQEQQDREQQQGEKQQQQEQEEQQPQDKEQQQQQQQQQNGARTGLNPIRTDSLDGSKQRQHGEQEAAGKQVQATPTGQQAASAGLGATDSSKRGHGDNQHNQQEGGEAEVTGADSHHGGCSKQQDGAEEVVAAGAPGPSASQVAGCTHEAKPDEVQAQQQQQQQQQPQQQGSSAAGPLHVKDMVEQVLQLCELAADPETISAGLQLVSALQAVDPADAVFSTLCSPVLQRLAACDQPHPRVVRWALAWAAARLEGGTSAGSSSAAAEAALSIKTGQAGAAQQVPLSTEAVQQLMEELLDMAASKSQLVEPLHELLVCLADSDDKVNSYARSHRIMLLGALAKSASAKGTDLLGTVLQFVMGRLSR